MAAKPLESNEVVVNKWEELGPIDLNSLIKYLPQSVSSQEFGKSLSQDTMWGLLDLQQPTRVSGIGRQVFPSGNIYEGMFHHDRREGFGRLIWSDGAYYIGNWKRDKRSGKGTFVHANGDVEEG